MAGYIFVLIAYSLFHSSYTDIKRVPIIYRPIGFAIDAKIDVMRYSIGFPVLISFALAFTFMKWADVLIYTISFRVGIFLLLTIIPLLFPFVKRFNGHFFFFSFVITIVALLYFFIVELIL
ncbi:MAG: hypothetical protein ABIG69_00005 [Bacteroidota bacterium]